MLTRLEEYNEKLQALWNEPPEEDFLSYFLQFRKNPNLFDTMLAASVSELGEYLKLANRVRPGEVYCELISYYLNYLVKPNWSIIGDQINGLVEALCKQCELEVPDLARMSKELPSKFDYSFGIDIACLGGSQLEPGKMCLNLVHGSIRSLPVNFKKLRLINEKLAKKWNNPKNQPSPAQSKILLYTLFNLCPMQEDILKYYPYLDTLLENSFKFKPLQMDEDACSEIKEWSFLENEDELWASCLPEKITVNAQYQEKLLETGYTLSSGFLEPASSIDFLKEDGF